MKKKSFVWSCVVMTFFTACQQAEVVNQEAEHLRMSIAASINGLNGNFHSRYVGTDPSNVVFQNKDEIGVFMDDNPAVKWTYDGVEWGAGNVQYWPDKTNTHDFYAFYPYEETVSRESVPMPSLLSQNGTIESLSACDFLVAAVSQSFKDGSVVNFSDENSFRHVSSLLKLTFKGNEDLTSSILKNITVEGAGIVASTKYSFENDEVTVLSDEEANLLDVPLSHEMDGKDATFFFILNEKTDLSSMVTLNVQYDTDGKSYVARMENFAGNVFAGGMCQSYTITVKDRSLVISGSSITPWGVGESLDDIIINGEEIAE